MKLSTLNSKLITAATAAFAAFAAVAADISDVIVRQQWPWSTDIKVEFKLTNVTTPVTVNVEASEGNTPLDSTNLRNAITGDLWGLTEGGVYSFMIDPKVAFGEERAAIPNFKVRLSLTDAPANADEILYKIVDLDNYTSKDITRADFMNGKMGDYVTSFKDIYSEYNTSLSDVLIWTGVTNVPEYKTSKMVMRRIPAKDATFRMGRPASPASGIQYTADNANVTLTNDFFISVFEVTEGQYKRLTAVNGTLGSSPTSKGDSYPVGNMSYNTLRGNPANWTDWPDDQHCVASGTAIAKMRANMPALPFDLPTEAQWEFACRAGTITDLYIGKYVSGASTYPTYLGRIAWYNTSLHIGGMKHPNAFGLYDMVGNQAEHCRDLFTSGTGDSEDPPALSGDLTEPYGVTTGTSANHNINEKGGYYGRDYAYCSCGARRLNHKLSTGQAQMGFRLWLPAE
jgi:formylglycine-generating enzyme required for sulfatase activity